MWFSDSSPWGLQKAILGSKLSFDSYLTKTNRHEVAQQYLPVRMSTSSDKRLLHNTHAYRAELGRVDKDRTQQKSDQ